ncbi:MAG: hypothetical protein SPK06_00740, partial [Kiritimatiellia bacterium]|nr:hypothetical protein [Kiritimatiellia bacterium]
GRRGELVLNVEFVEPIAGKGKRSDFHDRFIVNEMYTVLLPGGLDICDEEGKIKTFKIGLFFDESRDDDKRKQGNSRGGDNLKRGMVLNHQRRKLEPEKVDLPAPSYERIIRESPRVRLTVNG